MLTLALPATKYLKHLKPIATDELVGIFVECFRRTATPQTARHGRCQSGQAARSSQGTASGIVASVLGICKWSNLRAEELPAKAHNYPCPLFAKLDFPFAGMRQRAWCPCRPMSLPEILTRDFYFNRSGHVLSGRRVLRLQCHKACVRLW